MIGRLEKLIAAEALKQVIAHHGFLEFAVLFNGDNGKQFSPGNGRVDVFSEHENKIIATVHFNLDDDPDIVTVFSEDAYQLVKSNKFMEFNPEDYGILFDDPYIEMKWDIKEIREGLQSLAELPPPPPRVRMKPRPVRVVGGPEKKDSFK